MSHDIDADRMGTLDHADLVAPEDAGDQAKQIALAAQEWLGRAGRPNLGRTTATGQGPSPERRTRLPADLDKQLMDYVTEHGTTVSAFLRDAARESLARRTGRAA
jgi:hypothetical protein